jgi:hypothetical protein
MEGEKKDDGTGDPFKLLIEEALTQQRNEMMDNFTQILRQLPTGDASSSSGGTAPFKVQINFDIPIFEGQIDADVVDKWLNLLEGYFSIHNFSNREKITFALLKVIPHVKDWWETFCEKKETKEPSLFTVTTTWESSKDVIKEQYYPIGSYDDLYTKWTTLRQERDQAVLDFTNIFHTLHTKMGIKYLERHLVLKYRGGYIKFLGGRQSSTLIISHCSSCRHKENCRMTAIKSGPHTCSNSTSTSSIKQEAPTVSLIASTDHQS